MKRVRLLVLLGAIALALPFGLTAANATGSTGGTGSAYSVSIDPYADFDTAGINIDVKLYVRCTGTTVADVVLQQFPPETASPVAVGSGPQPLVVCDGNTHSVGVTVVGAGFDTGYAKATATLYAGSITGPVKAKSTRWVYINNV
jgi:hypothetical protein